MKKIILLEESQFKPNGEGKVVFKIPSEGNVFEEKPLKVSETELNIPFEYLNPIQTLFYKFYKGGNALVSAPTSAGKTGVALIFFHNRQGRIVYTAPTKALVMEKAREFKKLFGKVDIRTGDIIEEFKPVRHKVVVSTYENLALAFRNKAPWTQDIEAVVIDEVHAILGNRGQIVEELITNLLLEGIDILALSATVPGAERLAKWLQASLFIESRWRPVPLIRDIKSLKEFKPWINPKELEDKPDRDTHMALRLLEALYSLSNRDEKVIVFVPKKSVGWKMLQLANREKLEIANETAPFEVERQGWEIAFHNADVPKEEREKIEKAFREGELNKLVATQTLAYGVNLPADKVLIAVSGFYDRVTKSWKIFPDVLDILQEEGRAGRFGIKDKGYSYILTYGAKEKQLQDKLTKALDGDFKPFIAQQLEQNLSIDDLKAEVINQLALFILVAYLHRGEKFKDFLKESFSLKKFVNSEAVQQINDWLQEMGYIENSKLTPKALFCLKSGVGPVNFEEFLRRSKLPIPLMAKLRPLIYTKRLDSISYFLKDNERFDKEITQVRELIIPCGLGCFKDNTDQLLFFIEGKTFLFSNLSNPPGEYSYLGTDALHLLRTLLELRKMGELNLTNYELLQVAHSLKYGLELPFAPLGGIKGIGHIRANLLKNYLKTLSVEQISFQQKVEEVFQQELENEQNLKEELTKLLIDLRRLTEPKAQREANIVVSLLRRNKNSLMVDDKILTTFGLFLFGRRALELKKQELLEEVLKD